MPELRLGVAKAEITPSGPLPLAGFSHRSGPSQGVERPLFVRAFLWEQEGVERVLIVCADLIWWGPELVGRLRRELWKRFGLPESSVILHATHNHSGPQTSGRFSPLLGTPNPDYLAEVEKTVLESVENAATKAEPVTVERDSAMCRIGINRRRAVGGGIVMAPNEDGPVDPEVTVILFRTSSGRIRAALVHHACHPTTTDDNFVSSEFPGVTAEMLEQRLDNQAVVMYLQGCCGDVRPALVANDEFYRGGVADVDRLGNTLAQKISPLLARPMRILAPCRLASRTTNVSLRLQRTPMENELSRTSQQGTTVGGMSRPSYEGSVRERVSLEMTLLELADGLSLLALNGEPVAEYGLWVKKRFDGRVLPLGYSNGMIGYLPVAHQVDEGGYEARDSAPFFGLPAPFDRTLENTIKERITSFVEEEDWT